MKKCTLLSLIPLIILGISLLPLISFFHPGLPITHDGRDHVVRIANFYASLQEGILIPRWAGNLNWGYGHPILMFLYPFSSYTASVLHFIGFSFVDATKAVFVISYIASLLTMYVWMKEVWGTKVGFVGALLYGFAPYRFVDLYVRGAIGEHAAFVFPPLICYFLYKLAIREKSIRYHVSSVKHGIGLTVSFALFILSHNAISLMFLPVIGLYVLYLYVYESKLSLYFMLNTLYFILLGFGLSAFFWIPAFFEGKYTLRNIVTAGEAMTRFVPFSWFFYSPWNYGGTATLTKSIGYFQWIGLITSIIIILKSKNMRVRILLAASLMIFIFSLFIMTSASEFIWTRIKILQNFQFPWRFLSLTTFIAAVIGGIGIVELPSVLARFLSRYCSSYIIVCSLLIIASTIYMWHPKGYAADGDTSYAGIYAGTTDTGESSPIWSVRFMEHTPANPMEVIDGDAKIEAERRLSTIHEYRVRATKQTRLVENTLYFPGWKIYVDGISAGLQFQDSTYRGLMTFWIDEGDHYVVVKFTDTKRRRVATMISLASVLLIVLSGCVFIVCRKRK